ncbi:MAG: hypothetical protein JXR30_01275, partial [Alphaproteobacteria bacterium]|nr:hypothetical protein [Alphaproteobacteria bacterium]
MFFFLCLFSGSLFAEGFSCAQHFQKFYTQSEDKTSLEKSLIICGQSFQEYLSNLDKLALCKETIPMYCKTLTKSQTLVENYTFNPIKTMATLQTGFALGSASTTAILNWISPPLEIPKPTKEKVTEKAKKMTKSECLHQVLPEGTKGFSYDESRKICLVSDCFTGWNKSSNHTQCINDDEKKCLDKNTDSSWESANNSKHVSSYGYNESTSPSCYVSGCQSGWEVNASATGCMEIPEPETPTTTTTATTTTTVADSAKYGEGSGDESERLGDDPSKADAYAFRGRSDKIYFTKLSNAPSTIPDGSPLESNYVVSGYGM